MAEPGKEEEPVEDKPEEKVAVNLWESVLRNATERTEKKERNCTVVFVGDKGNGKSQILSRFPGRQAMKTQEGEEIPSYMLKYSYLNVQHPEAQEDEVRAQMNFWEMDDPAQAPVLARLLQHTRLEDVVYVITVDLSCPWSALDAAKKWVSVLEEVTEKATAEYSAERKAELLKRISKYNQFFIDPSVQQDKPVETDVDVDCTQPQKNLGVPLLVVGCKADSLQSIIQQQDEYGNRFEFLCRKLRMFSVEYGATLFLTSARLFTNVNKVLDYLLHRLYNYTLDHPAVLLGNDKEFGVYCPAGHDSLELINTAKPTKNTWQDEEGLRHVYKNPNARRTLAGAKGKRHSMIEATNNQVFYKTLKFTMDNAPQQAKVQPKAKRPQTEDRDAVKEFFKNLLGTKPAPGGAPTAEALRRRR